MTKVVEDARPAEDMTACGNSRCDHFWFEADGTLLFCSGTLFQLLYLVPFNGLIGINGVEKVVLSFGKVKKETALNVLFVGHSGQIVGSSSDLLDDRFWIFDFILLEAQEGITVEA